MWRYCGCDSPTRNGRTFINKFENVTTGLCWMSCRSRRSTTGLGYQKCGDGGSDDRQSKADRCTTQSLLPLLPQKRIERELHRQIQGRRPHLVIPLLSKLPTVHGAYVQTGPAIPNWGLQFTGTEIRKAKQHKDANHLL